MADRQPPVQTADRTGQRVGVGVHHGGRLIVGAILQRPASSVALAVGIVVTLAGAAVFLIIARKEGKRRFPLAVRITTVITSVVLVITATTAFVPPVSRDALVHDVLGFSLPAKEVWIADLQVIAVKRLDALRSKQIRKTNHRFAIERGLQIF